MRGLLGKKIGMSRVFNSRGEVVPVTILNVGPCVVTQVKTVENDGYEAVQIGYGNKKEKHLTKSLKGHFEKSSAKPSKVLGKRDKTSKRRIGSILRIITKFQRHIRKRVEKIL